MSSGFKEGYDYYSKAVGANIAAEHASEIIESVQAEIEALQRDIEGLNEGLSVDSLGGFIAEHWHGRTFNIDAILDENVTRAVVPESRDYASPDIKLSNGERYSSKYYKDADASMKAQAKSHGEHLHEHSSSKGAAKAVAEGREHESMYKGQKALVPSDQVEDVRKAAKNRAAKERVRRPEQVKRYEDTAERVTGKVSDGRSESKPLTKEESRELARESKSGKTDLEKHGLSTEQLATAEQIARTSLKAGLSAAAIAAVLQATPYILAAIDQLVRKGEIDLSELGEGTKSVAGGSAAAFITGSLSSAITESAKAGLMGAAMKTASPAVIATITVVAMNALTDSFKVARGELSRKELVNNLARNTFVSSTALVAGSAGAALLSATALSPVGYLLGSFVGSLLGGFTYESGQKLFMSFAVERGVTLFGLVDQDYELPDDVLKSIGIDVFEYERFNYDRPSIDYFEPDGITLDVVEPTSVSFTFPRRGVIGVGRIGYVA